MSLGGGIRLLRNCIELTALYGQYEGVGAQLAVSQRGLDSLGAAPLIWKKH